MIRRKWPILLFLLGVAAALQAMPRADSHEVRITEFDPGLNWLNVARPLTRADLEHRVVLLDFWTYGCINCIHVLEDLRRLEARFGERLTVIGVHTPKFDNEKNLDTLRNIVIRYRIDHPVVNDVDFELAGHYGMRAWPTQVLIDPEGRVVGEVRGEGNYEALERAIETLLTQYSDRLNAARLPLKPERSAAPGALLAAPGKIAVSERHVAISDTLHHRVILADHTGRIEAVYGGSEPGFTDGTAAVARFTSPQGLAFGAQGLFVADTGNHAIRYIDPAAGTVATVAGGGAEEIGRSGEYEALKVRLRSPWDLALRDRRLFVAMAGNHQIWALDLKSGRIGVYAGSGREGLRDGALVAARFSQPSGLSLYGKWLYVADAEDSAVRRIDTDDGRVETLVGTGLFDFGDRDGPFRSARLQHTLGVAALSDDQVLIADTYNHRLKRLDLGARKVAALAGDGTPGRERAAADGLRLNEPGGLAVLDRAVLVADTNNNRIVRYDLDSGTAGEWVLTQP